MEEKKQTSGQTMDLGKICSILWAKRKKFFMMWGIVFALSCLWILPQPRYYKCEVKLAPEGMSEDASGLAGLASSFGVNLGGEGSSDAIYPLLYPDLFASPEFLADLLKIKVETDDGSVKTDYYTYLKKYQKKNWLLIPFAAVKLAITKLFSDDETGPKSNKNLNPFRMSKKDAELMEGITQKITCDIDKKTSVITLDVKDQDRLVCALLADSIRERLQAFIITYRTKKVRQDEAYYKHLVDSAKIEYIEANNAYGAYLDGHRNVVEQAVVQQGDKLKNDMEIKLQAYNTFNTQYQAAKAKVQERIPSFTTLKSATVPQKPAGPKRMLFVLGMLMLSTIIACGWFARKEIFAMA